MASVYVPWGTSANVGVEDELVTQAVAPNRGYCSGGRRSGGGWGSRCAAWFLAGEFADLVDLVVVVGDAYA